MPVSMYKRFIASAAVGDTIMTVAYTTGRTAEETRARERLGAAVLGLPATFIVATSPWTL